MRHLTKWYSSPDHMGRVEMAFTTSVVNDLTNRMITSQLQPRPIVG